MAKLRFYKSSLKTALAQRMEAVLNETGTLEQMPIHEELALVRDAASQMVELYAGVCELKAIDPAKVDQTQVVAVAQAMISTLGDVAKLAEQSARIDAIRHHISNGFAGVIDRFVTQVLHAAFLVWGDDFRLRKFEQELRGITEKEIGAGEARQNGTDVTPDLAVTRQVLDMDATIPLIEMTNGQQHHV